MFHFGFGIAREEFERFAFAYAFAPDMRLALGALRARGFDARSVVDVGAFKGNWSRMAREVFPNARLAMIEPNQQMTDELRTVATELHAELHVALLGATDGAEVTFHLMESGSSVYEERSQVKRTSERRTTSRLDSVLAEWTSIDLLKMDAQGYELEILAGARRLLPETNSVLLEVSLIQTNRGAPLMAETIARMDKEGFVAYDVFELHRRPIDRALNQMDILFVRKDSPLLKDLRHS